LEKKAASDRKESGRQSIGVARRCLERAARGRHMMPWPACAFLRAAHGHAKALRMRPLRWQMQACQARGVAEDASARVMTTGLAFPIVYSPARWLARTAECPWLFQDELPDKI